MRPPRSAAVFHGWSSGLRARSDTAARAAFDPPRTRAISGQAGANSGRPQASSGPRGCDRLGEARDQIAVRRVRGPEATDAISAAATARASDLRRRWVRSPGDGAGERPSRGWARSPGGRMRSPGRRRCGASDLRAGGRDLRVAGCDLRGGGGAGRATFGAAGASLAEPSPGGRYAAAAVCCGGSPVSPSVHWANEGSIAIPGVYFDRCGIS